MVNRRIGLITIVFILSLLLALPTAYMHERNDGGYFTIVDENGTEVYATGRKVQIGDEFLTENNNRYQVYQLNGDTAYAKKIGTIDLKQYTFLHSLLGEFQAFKTIIGIQAAEAQQGAQVAVYHTHSDESYVPSDGKESIRGNGGIYDVGKAFVNGLKKNGIEAVQAETKHDPHDDMAYERSRRTAADLIKKYQPAAIFDIHRDAVPPKVYAGTINGQQVSKVQLVVGKYGPTAKQIEDFALKIKAVSDKKYPGLVKGIFFAKGGDYNQDLYPQSMLLEMGAHTNDKASAIKGATLFADVIPDLIGKPKAPAAAPKADSTGLGTTQTGPSGASKSIGWMVGLLVVGGATFLFLSTGSFKEAGAKIKQFTTKEFASFFGPQKKINSDDSLNEKKLEEPKNDDDSSTS